MAKLPYMQFYPGDWLLDTHVLSVATRGIWIDILCLMWREEPRTGTLEYTMDGWCKRLRCTDHELRTAVMEMELENVCKIMKDESKDSVRFTSRRIARDEKLRKANRLYVAKYRSKLPCKEVVNDLKEVRKVENQNQSHISESEVREEKKEERKKKSSGQVKTLPGIPKSAFVWQAYSEAYRGRYGIEPVRNRQTNALLCLLVDKLGEQEAPLVASFYLSHNNPFYVAKRHPPNLLLQDAEGLRTQWATGVKSTTSEVKHAEFKDNLMGKIARVEQILSERRQA